MDSASKVNYAKMVDELKGKINLGEIEIVESLYIGEGKVSEVNKAELSGNELDFSASIAKGAMLHELNKKVESGEVPYIDSNSNENIDEFVSLNSDFEAM